MKTKNHRYRKRRSGRAAIRGAAFCLLTVMMAFFLWNRQQEVPFQAPESGSSELIFAPDQLRRGMAVTAPEQIPAFYGSDFAQLDGNTPNFTQQDLASAPGEGYSELDALGRCGPAMAMLDRSMMPKEEREDISQIRPSGWHTVKYPDLIEDRYLYNRCHLIAYAMTGQNGNPRNLVTGTRYMNTVSMLAFELRVLRYLDEGRGRVLYRVTPYFRGDELVCRGVEMEACSVEDQGSSLSFHVFVYNYQPGITIDYLTGSSAPTAGL